MSAKDSSCPTFTAKQDELIRQALSHEQAKLFDMEYLVSAVLIKESFVGNYVVKIRPEDGNRMSVGVMHTMLSFVQRYEGVKSSWEARQDLVPRLLEDDNYSITMGVNFLIEYSHLTEEEMIFKYNPSRSYVLDILRIKETVERCYG